MTTTRDVKRMLEPMLAEHADLALVGRFLVLKPIRHHLRCVCIYSTSSADVFDVRWFVFNLFHPRLRCHASWGENIGPGRPGGWLLSSPDIPRHLRETIERKALPILRPIETFEQFVAFIRKGGTAPGRTMPHWKLHAAKDIFVMSLALGDLDTARHLAETRLQNWPKPTAKDADVTINNYHGAMRLMDLLAKNDRAGIAAALHEFEAATTNAHKLEPYWQPTPFPIEAM